MNLSELIAPNQNFQTSVNIDFDFGDKTKVEELIPTDAVCHYLEEILGDVITQSNHRAKLFVGAYGKGKSHVVLAALSAMWIKEPAVYARLVEAYKKRGFGFGETFSHFVTGGRRLLPVIINGSATDLRHSLLSALRNSLRANGYDDLMPQTNYDGAIAILDRWSTDFPDTLERFEDASGTSYEAFTSRLRNIDTIAYEDFIELYPQLTSGSSFDALEGADVIDVYGKVIDQLRNKGVYGVYVVYDEFSKYLETGLDKATVEDTRLLQDFAEACNRSAADRQMHLLLISHKSLTNYIDSKLPKEKVDGWRGVSGRFDEIVMHNDANQYYELMAAAITKDSLAWKHWLSEGDGINKRRLDALGKRYLKSGLFDSQQVPLVMFDCYPLHPVTAYLLPRLSERVAQNERTLFTYICSTGNDTLSGNLAATKVFVTPDCVYDYFEPLLRKEMYSSPLHRVYELVQASLAHIESGSLAARIIKTIGAIDAVAQFDAVAPTRQMIVDVFSDAGFSVEQINAAIETLVNKDSIVYLRRSNSYLQLKETTGVPIDQEVSDRAESLRNTLAPTDILNQNLTREALYPSRYNEDYSIVRYFDCGFVDAKTLLHWAPENGPILHKGGDGEVVAVYCATPDEVVDLVNVAKDSLSGQPMTVVVYPRSFEDIDDALYRLEAARELKGEAKGDPVLIEEYEVVIEDYAEIIKGYVAGFFQPELGKASYYVDGRGRKAITRRRKLSDQLSDLCTKTFDKTPCITNEALNKNTLTGTAFSSRTKILKALCAPTLAPNLGFVGNGQETSMARSAMERTGIVKSLADDIDEPGKLESGMKAVLSLIHDFLEHADDSSFGDLYRRLTDREMSIGMRRGPIPIYLAYVMRDFRDEIKITHGGEERPISETLLDDLSENPDAYRVTRLNWSPAMGAYVKKLAKIFGCEKGDASRSDVVEAIRLWYAALPQVTRNCLYDHTQAGKAQKISETRSKFFKGIRRIDTDADVLLFKDFPQIFDADASSDKLVAAVEAEKRECDGFLDECIDGLTAVLIGIFEPSAPNGASLSAVLKDWLETHPTVKTRSFTGVDKKILTAITTASGDDRLTAGRIAKAATSLRVDDWNDARFEDFPKIISSFVQQVEGDSSEATSERNDGQIGILLVGPDGAARRKTFNPVKTTGRSRLLRNGLVACLGEMGGALSPEEKRQVVFDVLRELC
ncbi:hypothetical protein [Olsenella uli]|uniref:hypothetical protein n=1 Tax=Olsenella uli TaxID=133926 RepID=UPI0024A80A20|nr:hypothetical protein [Olsenella uli]